MGMLILGLSFLALVLLVTHPVGFAIFLGFVFVASPVLILLGLLAYLVAGVIGLRAK